MAGRFTAHIGSFLSALDPEIIAQQLIQVILIQ